jgi:hypothetical protein
LGELQKQGNAKGSSIFTMQEMQQIATGSKISIHKILKLIFVIFNIFFFIDNKIQFDNFQEFVDYLNEQSLLLKKGPGTFQLRT